MTDPDRAPQGAGDLEREALARENDPEWHRWDPNLVPTNSSQQTAPPADSQRLLRACVREAYKRLTCITHDALYPSLADACNGWVEQARAALASAPGPVAGPAHEKWHSHTMKIGAFVGTDEWQVYCTECDEAGRMDVPAAPAAVGIEVERLRAALIALGWWPESAIDEVVRGIADAYIGGTLQ